MTIKHTLLIIAISLLTLLGCQDSTTQNNNEGKSVGFQLIEEQDYTRTVTGGSSPSKTYPRPIRTYLWYPARKSNDAQPMHFGQYAKLADEDIWPSQIVGNLHQDFKYLNRACLLHFWQLAEAF